MFRTPKLLKKFSHVITERSVEMTDSLAEAAAARGGIDMDISLHTQRLTLDIVGLTAFSHDFKQVRPTFHVTATCGVSSAVPLHLLLCAHVLKHS
jgi:hypothetical protein